MKKGISLVALVITIIVLIILTAAVILTATNTNIFGKSEEAVFKNNVASFQEELTKKIMEKKLEDPTFKESDLNPVDITEWIPSIKGSGYENSFIIVGGKLQYNTSDSTAKEAGWATELGITVSANGSSVTTYTSYEIGDEVTVRGEDFYVLEASDENTSTVTLLAKYNLNTAGTEQAKNASYEDTKCEFSSTNYWFSEYSSYTDWENEKFDINTVSEEAEGDAIYKAKAYATTKGGTNGRLLKYEEVDALKTSYQNMIFGKANQQGVGSSNYFLYYWLSSMDEDDSESVWYVNGFGGNFITSGYYDDGYFGVRPVLTVSKSLIS